MAHLEHACFWLEKPEIYLHMSSVWHCGTSQAFMGQHVVQFCLRVAVRRRSCHDQNVVQSHHLRDGSCQLRLLQKDEGSLGSRLQEEPGPAGCCIHLGFSDLSSSIARIPWLLTVALCACSLFCMLQKAHKTVRSIALQPILVMSPGQVSHLLFCCTYSSSCLLMMTVCLMTRTS